jgi:hypothetical protein
MLRNCDDGRQKIRRMSEEKGEKGKDGERGRMKDADTNYDIVRMAEKSRTQWQRTRGQRKQRGKGKRSRGQMHSEEERGNKRWSDHRKERQAHIWRSEAERGTSIGTEKRRHVISSVLPSVPPSICSLGSKNLLFLIHPPAQESNLMDR